MTVVIVQDGVSKTITMVETIMEHHRGLIGLSTICIMASQKIIEVPRDTLIHIVGAGLNPRFYDENGQKIPNRWMGYKEVNGEPVLLPRDRYVRPTAKGLRLPRQKGPTCEACGGPTEYEGEPCKNCRREFNIG